MTEPELTFRSLTGLNKAVVSCELCPRLVKYCRMVGAKKRRQFLDWDYWSKPLPGFGDQNARLLMLGLAPAAHGGNRTGRMFTGDGSAQFLMSALHKHGFANQPTSISRRDGLRLHDAYMTAIVRCAPPKNKPTLQEVRNCARYWTRELRLLSGVKVALALGRVAFDTYVRHMKEQEVETRELTFRHAAFYTLPAPYPALAASYHPSRQNTQTGKLTREMFDRVFLKISSFLDSPSVHVS